ncbi:hypothetical protein [Rheinheimera sp.]|uniref:hypothetical protein n=1 Tax=Rheinheimera sp. TaxID=1869214 RepID=UPI0023524C34|nr:hypothetical protein [Rheinheimera sp.]
MGAQDREWFNEPRDRVQHYPQEQKHSSGISYSKLYLTIVASILTAFAIMAICSLLFSAALIKAFTYDMKRDISVIQQPQQQNSTSLQRDLQRLASKPIQAIADPLIDRAEQLNKKSQQQAAANKADVQTCNFWRQQYQNEKSDRNKMHANSACSRAHGAIWTAIK